MKELEALDVIEDTRYDLGILRDFDDAVSTLRKALTPPTQEEVCKALSEYIQWDVIYIKHNKEFMMKIDDTSIDNTSIVKVNMFGSVKFNAPLNARLITLIGRFYENEVKEK